jgi:hypothetical protein
MCVNWDWAIVLCLSNCYISANVIVFADSVSPESEVKPEIILRMGRKSGIASRNDLLESINGKIRAEAERSLVLDIVYRRSLREDWGDTHDKSTIYLTCLGAAMRLHEDLNLERLRGLLNSWVGVADVDVEIILGYLEIPIKEYLRDDKKVFDLKKLFQIMEHLWKQRLSTQ